MAEWQQRLQHGVVVPACPLMLNNDGSWSSRHQSAVLRYYAAAGAGGLAIGVHSTQFEIRSPEHGLFEPLLRFTADVLTDCAAEDFVRIGGICGLTKQAIREARLLQELGYHAGLVSLAGLSDQTDAQLLQHVESVARELPVMGFYLQPAVGGRYLSYDFWRRFCDVDNVVAIKVAPFNRYCTTDVVRAVMNSGRDDIALYTGNDDNIVGDLLTPFRFGESTRFFAGGLLGQWAIGTRTAAAMLREIQSVREQELVPSALLSAGCELTDLNSVIFDAANGFQGCIPGINEVLRRQGLAPSARCLDPQETLSPGQAAELDRVLTAYSHLTDEAFVREHLDEWLG